MDIIDPSVALSACTNEELQDAARRIGEEVNRRDTGTADGSVATCGVVRLSVYLARDVAATLKDNTRRKGISITQAIRRAIAVWAFIEEARRTGSRIALIEDLGGGEERLREVLID